MTFQQGKYNMKAVSKLLGIQPGTLRAWERRYKIIAPERNEAGHRLYTERHIYILRWLLAKVNEGFTISQAVILFEESESEKNGISEQQSEQLDFSFHEITCSLLSALLNFDEEQANKILAYSFSLYSVEKTVIDLTRAIFAELRLLKEQKKLSTGYEQYIFNFMRSKVGAIYQAIPADRCLPTAITVCGPDEKHELGLLLFSLFLRSKGHHVIYLGTCVTERDLIDVINEVKPKFLFSSFTTKNREEICNFIARLLVINNDLKIGIGGQAVQAFQDQLKDNYQKYIIGPTKSDWEIWLKKQSAE